MSEISTEEQLRKMREDWDQRATENARYYVNTANHGVDRRGILRVRREDRGGRDSDRPGEYLPGKASGAKCECWRLGAARDG